MAFLRRDNVKALSPAASLPKAMLLCVFFNRKSRTAEVSNSSRFFFSSSFPSQEVGSVESAMTLASMVPRINEFL